jgi:hypothetical protein
VKKKSNFKRTTLGIFHQKLFKRSVICIRFFQFLDFTFTKGNDLITAKGEFPGLKVGNFWCLCSVRWGEAEREGKAPKINLKATHIKTLETGLALEDLKKYEI